MGIRVAVIDDNPHVRWHGQVYPVNATFHRFLSAFLDLEGAPVASIAHVVPMRELPDDAPQPQTLPLDPRLEVIATAPFDGIAGYLRQLPVMVAKNIGPLGRAIRDADLVWLKVPASNAALAAALSVRHRVPRFVWVAGSAQDVAKARFSGPSRAARVLAGAAYDLIGHIAGIGGQRVVVGHGLINGRGFVTTLLDPPEIRTPNRRWPRDPQLLRLAWAGRIAPGKGVEGLLDAVALLVGQLEDGPHVELVLLGTGSARPDLEARAGALRIVDRIDWRGYVGNRAPYLEALASCDMFVFPSVAEGFPKVILDAMAVGVPVIGTRTGTLAELGEDRLEFIAENKPPAIVDAILRLRGNPERAASLQSTGLSFAKGHTRHAEARRLVTGWRGRYPSLPWHSQ